jgi:hypothetical protein
MRLLRDLHLAMQRMLLLAKSLLQLQQRLQLLLLWKLLLLPLRHHQRLRRPAPRANWPRPITEPA